MRTVLNPAWVTYIQATQAPPPPPVGTLLTLFPATEGPDSANSASGPVVVGTEFHVTQSGLFLAGFWWYVCQQGSQSTAAQPFALWQVTSATAGTLVAGSAVTSATLVAGEWNCVSYSTPLALTAGVPYRAATGLTGPYPSTLNEWNSGGPYAAGIVNGPLSAYSDATGSASDPYGSPQSSFTTAGSNPAVNYPGSGNSGFNVWLDVEITTVG